jgi:putative hydrolase of the HAD superfamily
MALQRAYSKGEEYWTLENAQRPIATRPDSERYGFYTEYERYLLSIAGLDVPLAQARKIYQLYASYPRRLRLFDDTLPTMVKLAGYGIKIGLISNNDRPVESLCEELLLTPHLAVALSSIVVGCEKPDPRIFQEALHQTATLETEAVHIGDQYHSDVVGAKAAGIRPILIDRYGFTNSESDCPCISNLWQLPNLLCALH